MDLASARALRLSALEDNLPGRPAKKGLSLCIEDGVLADELAPLDEAGAQWRKAAELQDGEALQLPEGQYTTYYRRTIQSPTARRMRAAVAARIWLSMAWPIESPKSYRLFR